MSHFHHTELKRSAVALLYLGTLALGMGFASGADTAKAPTVKAATQPKGDPFPLDHCVVSGRKIPTDGKPFISTSDGREVRFCGPGCQEQFAKDPAPILKKLDAEIVKQQLPYYPLDTCLVTGGKIGSMGEGVNYVYKNRLVRFCCAGCPPAFEKDPGKYMKQLDAAVIKAQKPRYPLDICPVLGAKRGEHGGKGVDFVFANRYIWLCCPMCVGEFRKSPQKFMEKFEEALKAKGQENYGKAAAPAPGTSVAR